MENSIYSDSWDGNWRNLFPKECTICKIIKYVPKHVFKKFKYCSIKCRGIADLNQVETCCAYCDKKLIRMASKIREFNFCNRKCKEDCQSAGTIKEILPSHYNEPNKRTSYRKRALRFKGVSCSNPLCEIIKSNIQITEGMLDVDHIDGDRKNNKLENLQVLCVWCHRKKTIAHGWEKKK